MAGGEAADPVTQKRNGREQCDRVVQSAEPRDKELNRLKQSLRSLLFDSMRFEPICQIKHPQRGYPKTAYPSIRPLLLFASELQLLWS